MHDDYPVQVGDPASDECVHTTVGELSTGKAACYHKAESVENFCENIIQRLGALSLDISDSVW